MYVESVLDITINSATTFVVFGVTCLICVWHRRLLSGRKFPPGPWGYPIVGHLPMLGTQPHETLMRMREKYGDVFTIQYGSIPAIVISGNEAIREALVTKAGTFEDRPNSLSFNLSPMDRIGFSPYNKRWTVFKKIVRITLHQFLEVKDMPLDLLLQDESVCLINDIIAHKGEPFDPKNDLFISACSAAYQLCYGRGEDIRADDDFRRLFGIRLSVAISSAGNPVEVMPWLKFIMPWKAKPFTELCALFRCVLNQKVAEHKDTFVDENLRDMTDVFLNMNTDRADMKNHGITRDQLLGSLTEIIPAAFDTTGTALLWMCLFMVRKQDIQRKVQDEIDREIGPRRISVKSDRAKLPYTEAVILESLRMKLPMPTSLPHAAYRDTKFRGYDVLKGTMVIVNLHSITRDSTMFTQPEQFRPEHFLSSDGSLNTEKAKFILPFGLGVRKCIGEKLARDQLFMIFTTLMQRFTLCKVEGEEYDLEGVSALADCPKPYKLIAKLRYIERHNY